MTTAFTVVASDSEFLWTVGFTRPDTGRWEAASDHSSPSDAEDRADHLNGDGNGMVYLRSEPRLWTVGYYVGKVFEPISDHDTEDDAARECARLNGSEVDR